jgi:hypothetical protein
MGLRRSAVMSARDKMHTKARRVAIYLTRLLCGHSYERIADTFGVETCTAKHSVRYIESALARGDRIALTVGHVKARLGVGAPPAMPDAPFLAKNEVRAREEVARLPLHNRIDPAVWRMVEHHPDKIPDDLRRRLLPVVVADNRRRPAPLAGRRWRKMRAIINLCSEQFGIPVIEILSERRDKAAVHARHVACYLATRLTTLSLPAIGKALGDRDHTTVLHAVRKIAKRIQTDHELARMIASMIREIETA